MAENTITIRGELVFVNGVSKHPAALSKKDVNNLPLPARKEWEQAMIMRGFIKRNGTWIPAHEIKEV